MYTYAPSLHSPTHSLTRCQGFPLRPGDDAQGSAAQLGLQTLLFVDGRVCRELNFNPIDDTSYPLVTLNYYPKPNEPVLAGAVRVSAVTFASFDPAMAPRWCILELKVTYQHLSDYPSRSGPVVVRLWKGKPGDSTNSFGSSVLFAKADIDSYEVVERICQNVAYLFTRPLRHCT